MRGVFADSRGTYGSPRVTAALRQQGVVCNRKRVARLMRLPGLVAKHHRRRVQTTDSRHRSPVAPNRLARDFRAAYPNAKWVADITYIATAEGWLYLALVMDLFSRKIVELLADAGVTVSMSHTADPYDNAVMESYIGTLKTECADCVFPS
jgi:transposase InsO family protein